MSSGVNPKAIDQTQLIQYPWFDASVNIYSGESSWPVELAHLWYRSEFQVRRPRKRI